VSVDIIAASGFDAVGATGTILPPVDAAEFAYPVKSPGGRSRVNVITVGHLNLPQ
jgi:hypothetical protein